MTPEAPKEEIIIPSDLPGFWKLIVSEFKETESVRNIRTIAQKLVKKEGMERFASYVESEEELKAQLKSFLGEKKWKEIEQEEVKRWFEGDRDMVSAAGG